MNLPAHRTSITEMVDRRDAAIAKINEAAQHIAWGKEIAEESREIAKGAHCGAQFYLTRTQDESAFRRLFADFNAKSSVDAYRRWLDARCWQAVIQLVGLGKIMDRTALEELEAQLSESGRPIARLELDQLESAVVRGDVVSGRKAVDDILAAVESMAPQILSDIKPEIDAIVSALESDRPGRAVVDVVQLKPKLVADVPPFTMENIEATIEARMAERVTIFRRGLARTFSDLDRRFRSHDAFKLKHRIIFTEMYDQWGTFSYYRSTRAAAITDVERAFLLLDGRDESPGQTVEALRHLGGQHRGRFRGEIEVDYFRAKVYQNGNVHLWFTRKDLLDRVNCELAAWYGNTLGDDSVKEGVRPEDLKGSTALATKLQFFATPSKTAKKVIDLVERQMGQAWIEHVRILEPSAGEGALCLAALEAGATDITAVEVHPGRCDVLERVASRNRGKMRVTRANFLDLPPRPDFDLVIMNPPFHRTHYMQHVTRAMDWLNRGGILVAVLPASAELMESKKHTAFRKWVEDHRGGEWGWGFADLPPESFAESGTKVNTCTLVVQKK